MSHTFATSSSERAKKIARKFDHGAIYWHIAGSYSPLTLIAMRTAGEPVWAWVILGDVCHMIATWKVLQMFIIS